MTYTELAEKCGWSRQNAWMNLNRRHGNKPNAPKGPDMTFGNVKLVCKALGLRVVIESTGKACNIPSILSSPTIENVGYASLQEILRAAGYTIYIAEDRFQNG